VKRPTLLMLGVIWLAVVVVASAVTWVVIDSAGRDVLSPAQAEELPVGGVTSGPDPTRGPRESPSPSSTPSDSPSSSPTDTPSTSTPVVPQVRSWQGAAGAVTARCEGRAISLVSASPSNGWAIEVDKRGPREVRVELETGGDDELRTRVRGRCVGGAPRFEVDTDD
jgi:hypothetical protein